MATSNCCCNQKRLKGAAGLLFVVSTTIYFYLNYSRQGYYENKGQIVGMIKPFRGINEAFKILNWEPKRLGYVVPEERTHDLMTTKIRALAHNSKEYNDSSFSKSDQGKITAGEKLFSKDGIKVAQQRTESTNQQETSQEVDKLESRGTTDNEDSYPVTPKGRDLKDDLYKEQIDEKEKHTEAIERKKQKHSYNEESNEDKLPLENLKEADLTLEGIQDQDRNTVSLAEEQESERTSQGDETVSVRALSQSEKELLEKGEFDKEKNGSFENEGKSLQEKEGFTEERKEQLREGGGDEDEAEKEEDMEKLIKNESENYVQKNVELQRYYQSPLLTSCEEYSDSMKYSSHSYSTLSFEDCRDHCLNQETVYATLVRGKCLCYSTDNTPTKILNLESCRATCEVKDKQCYPHRLPHVMTMKTGSHDGGTDWTIWMSVLFLDVKVKYKGCYRNKATNTECHPEFQRKITKETNTTEYKTLIGCFTSLSLHEISKEVSKNYFKPLLVKGKDAYAICQQHCRTLKTRYSVVFIQKSYRKSCLCTDSLKRARPTNTCPTHGVAVFFTQEDNDGKLLFEGEVEKKGKVLVLARYRSGSSMTQSFFVRYPNSMILFEPGKMTSTTEAGNKALLKALEAFYKCDANSLPRFFYNSRLMKFSFSMLSIRGQTSNNYYPVFNCYNSHPPVDCAPMWQEACESSSFLNVKTIRVFSTLPVQKFVERNSDVHVIHLVRDPKSLLAAQKVFGKRSPYHEVCNQMAEIGKMVHKMREEGFKNIHEVFYEELATNASYYGAKLYREMNLEMPKEVSSFLSREEFSGESIPKGAKEVVRKDPTYHMYRFLLRYKIQDLADIDKACRDVYALWPEHYTDLPTMYKDHKLEIEHYIPNFRLNNLRSYFSQLKKFTH